MPATPEPPRAQLARGLRAGNLALIRAASRQLDPLPLDVAFEVLMLIQRYEPERWPKAGVRWIGRVALEHPGVALQDVRTLADALLKLDDDAAERLAELEARLGLHLDVGMHLWPAPQDDRRAPR